MQIILDALLAVVVLVLFAWGIIALGFAASQIDDRDK